MLHSWWWSCRNDRRLMGTTLSSAWVSVLNTRSDDHTTDISLVNIFVFCIYKKKSISQGEIIVMVKQQRSMVIFKGQNGCTVCLEGRMRNANKKTTWAARQLGRRRGGGFGWKTSWGTMDKICIMTECIFYSGLFATKTTDGDKGDSWFLGRKISMFQQL